MRSGACSRFAALSALDEENPGWTHWGVWAEGHLCTPGGLSVSFVYGEGGLAPRELTLMA